MSSRNKRIGIDVGGSHVSAAIISKTGNGWSSAFTTKAILNSHNSAYHILTTLGNCIKTLPVKASEVEAVGIAFPGPFDYEKGISAVVGVGGKFEKTFGLHLMHAVKDITGLQQAALQFSNDAHCFATGAYHLLQLKSRRTIFITLGTGFGSAFMADGRLVYEHQDIPASGAFYDEPFNGAKADDIFSTRWILAKYKQLTGVNVTTVKELVESGNDEMIVVMNELGENLGQFLLPWLQKFSCDELIVGGNIAKAFHLFGPSLKKILGTAPTKINIMTCENTEDCIITGAAIIAGDVKPAHNKTAMRKTAQKLLPLTASQNDTGTYNIYPSFISGESVYQGFAGLAEQIAGEKLVIIDGYGGVLWDSFREKLHAELLRKNKTVFWYDVNTCLKTPDEIQAMIAANLNGDDPVFGKKYTGKLMDFFDEGKLHLISPDPSADICIIYGTGSALTGITGKLLYVDVPKNEIQFRMRAGSVTNLGAGRAADSVQIYKRFYFVDWPVLNKHKAQLLSHIDCIIDEQRINDITWMKGDAFRNALYKMLQQPFRARPWFEPGVWGGNWMKKHFPRLNQDVINYAWSFELITPENGIVIEGDKNLLEVSFDFLLFADNKKLLGKAAGRFGTAFPIRFDFLDTFDGGNLSVQCHPTPAYAKEHFGEDFTQDETYYILDCKNDASVYLGFQESIAPGEFKDALISAQENNIKMDVEKYVQKFTAHKHDLFLIPNGTIHASGMNNLVLEISSTPYIFTFKAYDWLRPGLNGQPRPINIEHAMDNLCFDRKGDYVPQKLISHPVTEAEWKDGRKINLPTHEEHFYSICRYEFTGSVQINTNDQCHICMLVQGKSVTVNAGDTNAVFQYAETFVIPAATGNYELVNAHDEKAFVVIAHVKDAYC
ncbi:MAG: ROK family protein [Chitinophagaceae bacterium]|nr:ROK family protein [Chitinophagaceae bacterium]